MSVPNEVKLLLCFDDSSKLALSIPLAQCTTFAITPLKWLRFLGFAIYGQQGRISMSMNGTEIDYTAQIEARCYYFIPDGKLGSYTLRSFLTLLTFSGEPRFVDVDAVDNKTSSTSDVSIRRAGFRDRLIERDGTCVLSGHIARACDACHLIPHSKGDSVRFHGSHIISSQNLILQSSTCQASLITDAKCMVSWTRWTTLMTFEMGSCLALASIAYLMQGTWLF